MSVDFKIKTYPDLENEETLSLVFSHLEADQLRGMVASLIAGNNAGEISFTGLHAVTRGEKTLGAAWVQCLPGKIGLYWPPQILAPKLSEKEQLQALHAVNKACLAFMDKQQQEITQVLFSDSHDPMVPILEENRFKHMADLMYLYRDSQQNSPSQFKEELLFEPFAESELMRLERLLERTYIKTLDCPKMEGMRNVKSVVEGYRSIGLYKPERWLFAKNQEGEDVGVCLLTDHPAARQWELIYMGIVPEARGRGYGQMLTAHALKLAAVAHAQRVVLAVDMQNNPAGRIYQQLGFQAWDRRAVYMRRGAE